MNCRKLLLIILIICLSFLFSCKKNIPDNIESPHYSIHTGEQNKYLEGDYALISLYAKGVEELSRPNPVTLTFDESYRGKTLLLSTDYYFKTYESYVIESSTLSIYNLYLNKIYYYKVDDKIYDFKILDMTLRNIYVDGLTNVRDLGGYETDNGLIKQGLLYRGSKLNDDESTTALITDSGIDTMLNQLHIKTEIDLRTVSDLENGGLTSSILGSSVNYISYPLVSGGNILLLNKDEFKGLFEILADEANYPIYFHCSIGTDRTGALAFLINGLLGASKDDLYKDFLFSNFGLIGSNRTKSAIDTYINTVSTAIGDTLSKQIYNYLVSLGVSSSDLDKVISIMME